MEKLDCRMKISEILETQAFELASPDFSSHSLIYIFNLLGKLLYWEYRNVSV